VGSLARRLAALERAEREQALAEIRHKLSLMTSEEIARAVVMFRAGGEDGERDMWTRAGITEALLRRSLPPEAQARNPEEFTPEEEKRFYEPLFSEVFERKEEINAHITRMRSESSGTTRTDDRGS
jgi:hypothetical protein